MAFFTRRGVSVPELPADILQQDADCGDYGEMSACNSPTKCPEEPVAGPSKPFDPSEPSTSRAGQSAAAKLEFSYNEVDRTYGVEV